MTRAIDVSEQTLREFDYQVAGHSGIIVSEDGKMLLKPMVEREKDFYEIVNQNARLKEFFPEYHGTVKLAKGTSEENEENAKFAHNPSDKKTQVADTYICINNEVNGFKNVCMIDVKIGTQLYDIDATPEKQAKMQAKANERTTCIIGTSISGMIIHGDPDVDKQKLLAFNVSEYKNEGLGRFFKAAEEKVGADYRRLLLDRCIEWAMEYREAVQKSEIRMYGGSLLLAYDVCKKRIESAGAEGTFSFKAIDFAHSHWVPGQGVDEQYLFGLNHFIRILCEIRDE
ncbi:hypothetical protein GGI07_003574 [Coemansia sp. Benny D115]|nr:hypothetical protein GGI07_003574 [Coemansia sp. Benny D115]